jgi:methionine-rich copper-binding protein CopC
MKSFLRVMVVAVLSIVTSLIGSVSIVRAATPTLSSTSPAALATGVAIDADIILTFSEEVSAESGEITIYKWDDNTRFENIRVSERDKVLMGGKTVTINPTALFDYSTRYYVLIDGDAFDSVLDDQSFGGVESKVTINFSTVTAPPTTSPAVPPTTISLPKLGGKKCMVAGRTRTVGGVTFVCKKTTKLVWRRA